MSFKSDNRIERQEANSKSNINGETFITGAHEGMQSLEIGELSASDFPFDGNQNTSYFDVEVIHHGLNNNSDEWKDLEPSFTMVPDISIFGYCPGKRKMNDVSVVQPSKKNKYGAEEEGKGAAEVKQADMERAVCGRSAQDDSLESSFDKTYHFTTDHIQLMNELDSFCSDTDSKLTPCSLCDQPVALFQCQDCKNNPSLCEDCVKPHRHNSATSNHILAKLDTSLQELSEKIKAWILGDDCSSQEDDPSTESWDKTFQFVSPQELGEDDHTESGRLTDFLLKSRYYLRSSNKDKSEILTEELSAGNFLAEFLRSVLQGTIEGPMDDVSFGRTCLIISDTVRKDLLRAGTLADKTSIDGFESVLKSSKNVELLITVLMAIKSVIRVTLEEKAVFTLLNLTLLEEAVKSLYDEWSQVTTVCQDSDLNTPTSTGSKRTGSVGGEKTILDSRVAELAAEVIQQFDGFEL